VQAIKLAAGLDTASTMASCRSLSQGITTVALILTSI